MNIHGRHQKCQEGDNCTGAGCRISTGKTKRKANWKRPKPNQHEGTRASAAPDGKKGKK